MAASSAASDVSFDVSFETSSEDEFEGFSAQNIERTETRIRDRSGGSGRVSDDEVDVSDFVESNIASSDLDEMESEVVGAEVVDVPEKEWSNRLVDQPDIAFVDEANVGVSDADRCREMTAGQLFGLFFTD